MGPEPVPVPTDMETTIPGHPVLDVGGCCNRSPVRLEVAAGNSGREIEAMGMTGTTGTVAECGLQRLFGRDVGANFVPPPPPEQVRVRG